MYAEEGWGFSSLVGSFQSDIIQFTDDWVKIVCDDMQESLLKEEKEEAKENIELGWTEMYILRLISTNSNFG